MYGDGADNISTLNHFASVYRFLNDDGAHEDHMTTTATIRTTRIPHDDHCDKNDHHHLESTRRLPGGHKDTMAKTSTDETHRYNASPIFAGIQYPHKGPKCFDHVVVFHVRERLC